MTIPTSYTVKQVAESLGVCVTTIRYHIGQGNIQAVRIEGRLYVPPAELRRFRQNRRTPGNPDWIAAGGEPKTGKTR